MKGTSLILGRSGAVALIAALGSVANACTACMGDSESKFAEATNAAIFLMLACIGGVLALLSAFGIYLHRRALKPLPPHVEAADDLGSSGSATF